VEREEGDEEEEKDGERREKRASLLQEREREKERVVSPAARRNISRPREMNHSYRLPSDFPLCFHPFHSALLAPLARLAREVVAY